MTSRSTGIPYPTDHLNKTLLLLLLLLLSLSLSLSLQPHVLVRWSSYIGPFNQIVGGLGWRIYFTPKIPFLYQTSLYQISFPTAAGQLSWLRIKLGIPHQCCLLVEFPGSIHSSWFYKVKGHNRSFCINWAIREFNTMFQSADEIQQTIK